MRRSRIALYAMAGAVVIAFTLLMLPYTPKTAVRTVTVRRADLSVTALLDGTVTHCWQQPCIAPVAGRVEAVYVQRGQAVKRGELLFSLDAEAETQALASVESALASQKTVIARQTGAAIAALGKQSMLTLETKQAELRALIDAKRIRAQRDGFAQGVYISSGDYVAQGALLGQVCGSELQISALCRASEAEALLVGSPAMLLSTSGKRIGVATLMSFGAPQWNDANGQATQTLTLVPVEADALSGALAGERVIVELLKKAERNVPVVPLEAVDMEGRLWFIEADKAKCAAVDTSCRNDRYVRVSEEYMDATVILNPDDASLTQDCTVKAVVKD